ncbi:CLUMA_CG014368, isoform A [Clunio marinus]|uniref:CLUMA_CG014368, isoform A n=1 Tax=Clunio marinus TaxID=568069 RepID=A0A1J1IM66_9DIPT|nr:CLUMA_CG014368, isoform A [Clunio marinus]
MMSILFALLAFTQFANGNIGTDHHHPNVIIMHINNLYWNDLGIHVNRKDHENATPNIDYLAYSGIILNRFYANGGIESLLSGCYKTSEYGNTNLLANYFQRNGYQVNFVSRQNFDKIDAFEAEVLNAISNDQTPFLLVTDFGHVGVDINIPFVDEIVASIMTKAHDIDAMNNTIFLFLSLPDNNESPLEINIRRTAFIYSPLLSLQQRVSNQIIHVIDLLPTLVNASSLKWKTKDVIYVDGINQWSALNTNDEERLDVFGTNFYISSLWKLTYDGNDDDGFYGSIRNENMESDMDLTDFDFLSYVQTIFSSEIQRIFDKLSSEKIMYTRMRAKVHCNLKDIDSSAVENIRCSHASPCLFNLMEDPCEYDNKFEKEFDHRREQMKNIHERFLNGEDIESPSIKDVEGFLEDGAMVGIILGGTVVGCICIFIVVVCVKEQCNKKRSVYHSRSGTTITQQPSNESRVENGYLKEMSNGDPFPISTVSRNVKFDERVSSA